MHSKIHPAKEILQRLGITNPETVTTKQASRYLTEVKGVPTAPSSLEVYRCRSKGPRYKKIGGRIYYTTSWLDEYARGVEIIIFDPSHSKRGAV
jgi:hypothetical protein